MSECLSVCLSVCLSGWLAGWLAGWLVGWLSVWLAVCLALSCRVEVSGRTASLDSNRSTCRAARHRTARETDTHTYGQMNRRTDTDGQTDK